MPHRQTGGAAWDHPRICGEKRRYRNITCAGRGSPPHMRGKDFLAFCQNSHQRITPAYAGKSPGCPFMGGGVQDHPRICGEKKRPRTNKSQQKGSPPHMRGKDPDARPPQRIKRITPAYAGKSCDSAGDLLPIGDHPRICGEKSGKLSRTIKDPGSPPHMRGKGSFHSLVAASVRITPAYAGKRPQVGSL